MKRHRLRAPSADGALLAEPPLAEVGGRLAENVGRLGRWDHDFQGRSAGQLRAMARGQALAMAAEFLRRDGIEPPGPADADAPLFVTGHQPELFHPGVWVKNFAVAGLARTHGGVGLNLIVDNDIPKGSTIRVPVATDRGLAPRSVEFDDLAGEVPYEDLSVHDEGLFEGFGRRLAEALGGRVPDPLIDEFWPLALAARERTDRTGLRFAHARRAIEESWGVRNLELPLSRLCESEAFLWFASHLLAQLPRFQEVHNAALLRYRHAHGIRSRNHPVPALGTEGDWREAPFWVWRAESPRRRALLVRQHARTMELRINGEDRPFLELPLAADREACCAVEALRTLPPRRIRLRTRALTTTMFSRLILGDVFLHGIGGARYDELGDEIVRGFFGIEPPGYLTLSMTLWLGLEQDQATTERYRALLRELRDLQFNPERHLDGQVAPEVAARVEAKRRAIAGPVETHAQRLARFRAIRRSNEALLPLTEAARRELAGERSRLLAGLRHNALARNREYALVLHSRRRLREAMARAVPSAFPPSKSPEKFRGD